MSEHSVGFQIKIGRPYFYAVEMITPVSELGIIVSGASCGTVIGISSVTNKQKTRMKSQSVSHFKRQRKVANNDFSCISPTNQPNIYWIIELQNTHQITSQILNPQNLNFQPFENKQNHFLEKFSPFDKNKQLSHSYVHFNSFQMFKNLYKIGGFRIQDSWFEIGDLIW